MFAAVCFISHVYSQTGEIQCDDVHYANPNLEVQLAVMCLCTKPSLCDEMLSVDRTKRLCFAMHIPQPY